MTTTSKTASNVLMNGAEYWRCLEDVLARVVSFCSSRSLKEGFCVHAPVVKLCLHDHHYVNNNLLNLYGKCFGLRDARQLFDEMPHRDVVSWSGILSTYAKNGRHGAAIDLYRDMADSGVYPNAFTFSCVVRSCAALSDLDYGKRVHGSLVKHGLQSNLVVGSSLIELYSKFDSSDATKVFGLIDEADVVSWTTMISSSVRAGKYRQAFQLYIDMIKSGVTPNGFTVSKMLAASGFLGLEYGKLIHAHAVVLGVELNLVTRTTLVDMYSKCQRMEDAVKVAKLTNDSDVVLWTRIVSGFAQNSNFQSALTALADMNRSGVSPNEVTYLALLSECSPILSLDLGTQIHSRVITAGLEDHIPLGNALLDMYMKCSDTVEDGLRVFKEMQLPNVISWTSLIAGFSNHDLQQDSFRLFIEMRTAGVLPASYTLTIVLHAADSLSQTLQLHAQVIKLKASQQIFLGNALVDAYAGSGRIDDAWRVVRTMNKRDIITYTSLATRLNQSGHHKQALEIVRHIANDDGVKMDGFCLAGFLSASSYLGKQETGQQLHCLSVKSGFGSCVSVLNSLVDFYGKCGLLDEARRAFAEIREPDVVSWNGLMCGFASNGLIDDALSTFDEMRLAGVAPDKVSFLSVLFACQQGGLVDRSREYFDSFREQHAIEPRLEHYSCLIDTMSKARRLEEAVEVLETMPLKPDASIYRNLLAACRVHKNMRLGEDMARRGLELCPGEPVFYVWLAKLYDDCGRSDLAEQTRKSKREWFSRVEPDGTLEQDESLPEMKHVML
ncbi:unnamed protein product [Linum trigynum]|uniref:Pentatricopeptide repeat-containing protein n=1 Tax=Linum trigynum TaxID=586398 RepID=A0AAV2G2E7_9ROSI